MTEDRNIMSLLLIEDNPGDRELLLARLEDSEDEYQVETAGTLAEGIARLEGHATDLVLLDLDLPDCERWETVHRLRAAAPFLPIVVLTGLAEDQHARAALREGAQDYLVKGQFTGDTLGRAITYAWQRQRQQVRLDQLNRMLAGIRNVNQLIVREHDPARLCDEACAMLMEAEVYSTVWIFRTTPDGQPVSLHFKSDGALADDFEHRLLSGDEPHCLARVRSSDESVTIREEDGLCELCLLRPEIEQARVLVRRLQRNGVLYGYMGVAIPLTIVDLEGEVDLFDEVSGDIAFAFDNIDVAHDRDSLIVRYQSLFESTPSAVLVYAVEGDGDRFRIIDINPATERIARLKRDHIIGREVREVFPGVAAMGLPEVLGKVARTGERLELPKTEYIDDRLHLWVEVSITRIAENQVAAIFHDRTGEHQSIRALRDSEGRFRTLFEDAPVGIAIVDSQGRPAVSNKRLRTILGYSADELKRTPFTEFTHPEDVDKDWARYQQLVQGEIDHYSLEKRYIRRDGAIVYAELGVSAVRSRNGDPPQIIGVVVDTTERKQAEAELYRAYHSLRLGEQMGRLGYYERDWVTGEGYWSDGFFRLLGIEPTTTGSHAEFTDYVHPDDREWVEQYVQNALASGEPMDIEFRIQQPCGEVLYVHGNGETKYADDGTPMLTRGTFRDITAWRTIVDELSAREHQLAEAQRATHTGSWELDKATRKVTWSDEMFRLVGMEPAATAPSLESHQDIVHPDDWDEFAVVNRRAIEEGVPFRLYVRVILPNRETRILDTRGACERDENGIILRTRGTAHDITERVKTEEERDKLADQLLQSQKMESVGRLAGGVAHDFNNMLQTILGNCEIAQHGAELNSELRELLQEVELAAERSAKLTRQLLAFARKQTIEPRVLDLNESVSGMLKMLQRLIGEDISLAWLPGNDLGAVKVDPSQLDQILANLTVNARDAISENGTITVETGNVTFSEQYSALHDSIAPGDYVMLAVSDNGCGMDKETIDHIFEPFFTTKGIGKGTGLGLATIYGIVKQNHGLINVYSEPGEGTTFKIYFPREQVETETEDVSRSRQKAPHGTETVLLVEDEMAIIRMGTRILTRLGYTVLSANTPARALDLTTEHTDTLKLLITDVIMPEMNGRQLAQEVLKIQPDLRVLYMSGYTENVIVDRGVLKDGVNFIQKPFSSMDLARKVRDVLDET